MKSKIAALALATFTATGAFAQNGPVSSPAGAPNNAAATRITPDILERAAEDYCMARSPDTLGECLHHATDDLTAKILMSETCGPDQRRVKSLIAARKGRALAAAYDNAAQCYRAFVAANRGNAFEETAFELGMTATINARNAEKGHFRAVILGFGAN